MKKIILLAAVIMMAIAAQAQNVVELPEIKDPVLNEKFLSFQESLKAPSEQLQQLYQDWVALKDDTSEEAMAKKKSIEQQWDETSTQLEDMRKQFIRDNRDNELPAYALGDVNGYSYEELKELLDPTTGYYNSPLLDRAKAHLASLEKRQPGRKFAELEMKDLEGKDVKLSQFVGNGKYVLVDFWASWCGPCRMEMPTVVKSYELFKDKGYEIVGVSFDQKGDAWKAAVNDLGMTWPQMSDLKGWQCQANEVYGVNSIPSNILLNPDGIIVDHDLRGENLLKKLEEIFK